MLKSIRTDIDELKATNSTKKKEASSTLKSPSDKVYLDAKNSTM